MSSKHLLLITASLALMVLLAGCMAGNRYEDELKNPSLCNQQGTESERLTCFRYVALENNKPEYCEYYSGKKADCYTKVAVGMKNQSVCDLLAKAEEKYACAAAVAGDVAVDLLSDFLEGKNQTCVNACSDTQTQCYGNCNMAYGVAIQDCREDATGEALLGELGPCEDEAEDDKTSCNGRCKSAAKTCADKC